MPTPPQSPDPFPALGDLDRAAVDALLIDASPDTDSASPDTDSASPDTDSASTRQLRSLLSLLDLPVVPVPESLASRTLARVLAARAPIDASLRPIDADALDALALAEFRPERVTSPLRARARRHATLADLIAGTPCPAPSTNLCDRTLDTLRRFDEQAGERLSFSRQRSIRVRLADVVSIAALILIGFSLIMPVLSSLREQARMATCQANLQAASFGLSSYALANDSSLPMATAGATGLPWWNVGQDPARSNSANLYVLPRDKYVGLQRLACAGNRLAPTAIADDSATDWASIDELSYSFRVLFGHSRPTWGSPDRVVILTDRSPVVRRALAGNPVDPLENSPNHLGTGQQVLRADGSVKWEITPVVEGGDNIWLPRPIERAIARLADRRHIDPIRGTEIPEAPEDAFVGP
ncbi:MAG: hypothetical protein H6811_11865 [Phycisphaeraceae bacterium]|nr:hypothetical protein [Phycisphaeraceae bacterium]